MYVVKVGDYYIRDVEGSINKLNNQIYYISEIIMSKELMKSWNKDIAKQLAKSVNGEVICMAEEVTNE
jgi:hypothetical protein|nr:MAG TPA: hypothetical protein [Caudoviricetes sp.]